ncbi:hypothetical protein GIB67_020323 [Kingdonia uniflora]|uniref:AMP-dependent synthetase/ligase domain-containing protein n=1 Tax=Kingdonia uniflora TaxID=39325 RepID=A0A7J7NI28_9MAGN|nr:hypothetical protein GIB67_020323 [Kingdonia uniflora]
MDLLKPRPANSPPLTPLSFLDRSATVYGDCISIKFNNKTYTWSQTYRRCLRLASSLVSLGMKHGDIVSVVAPNIPAMYELNFAVPMCGAILSNINTRLDAHTISVILQHSESKVVFVDYEYASLVLEAISMYPLDGKVKPPRVVFIKDEDAEEVEHSHQSATLDYENMIKMGDSEFKWIRPKTEWDPMVLNYTSGTTSSPKGVVHCHRGLFILTVNSLIDWSVPKQPVYLWTLPMFHANGWGFMWGMAAVGGTNICIRKFDASTIYSLIRKHGVTHMCGAPVVLNMLANGANEEPLPHPPSFVDCVQFMIDEERQTYAIYWVSQTFEVGHLLTDSQRMGNIDLFGPSALKAGITLVEVASAEVHCLSQDFTLPYLEIGPDPG